MRFNCITNQCVTSLSFFFFFFLSPPPPLLVSSRLFSLSPFPLFSAPLLAHSSHLFITVASENKWAMSTTDDVSLFVNRKRDEEANKERGRMKTRGMRR